MTETSARLALPLLQPGQAQKELFHNEALALLDIAAQPVVEAVGVATPPTAPVPGQCWIVGAAPTGAWSGHAGAIAGWTSGGWRFVGPREGLAAWSVADGRGVQRIGGVWKLGELNATRLCVEGIPVVGARGAAIADPAGGGTTDGEARAAIAAILTSLRTHGLIAG